MTDAIRQFKQVLADYRGRHGRDAVRALPQGLLLDALDVGAPDTSHDQHARMATSVQEALSNFISAPPKRQAAILERVAGVYSTVMVDESIEVDVVSEDDGTTVFIITLKKTP
jgi:hypothetical protein